MARKKGQFQINYSSYKKYRKINRMLKAKTPYFTHDEIAKYCNCSKTTIQRTKAHKKKFPKYYIKNK